MQATASLSDVVRARIARESNRSLWLKTGVARSSISRLRSGDRDLTLKTLDRLAPALGLRLVESDPGADRLAELLREPNTERANIGASEHR
jgi:transcriptional regulator with XRE-family HTH domain